MSYILLIVGMTLDIISCLMYLKIAVTGIGSSGIPIISLFFYWIYVELQSNYNFLNKIHLFFLLLLFHIIFQYIIPFLTKIIIGRK